MRDDEIVELYMNRDEAAIRETEKKYGHYLTKIAYHVLSDWEDCKESVNDTYLSAWNAIPPHRPNILPSFLAVITRRISIDIYRKNNRNKRKISEYAISLSELDDCLSAGNVTEQDVDLHLLGKSINDYLRTRSVEERDVFIGRYYFADSIREVASYCNISESKTKSILYRLRNGLKAYLVKEGFFNEK